MGAYEIHRIWMVTLMNMNTPNTTQRYGEPLDMSPSLCVHAPVYHAHSVVDIEVPPVPFVVECNGADLGIVDRPSLDQRRHILECHFPQPHRGNERGTPRVCLFRRLYLHGRKPQHTRHDPAPQVR